MVTTFIAIAGGDEDVAMTSSGYFLAQPADVEEFHEVPTNAQGRIKGYLMTTNSHNNVATRLMAAIALAATGLAGCSTESDAGYIADALEYQQKGDNKAAVIQLKNALQKNPENAEARYRLGEIYNDMEDPQSAEKELRRALSLNHDPAKVWPPLGRALLAMGRFQSILDETSNVASANTDGAFLSLRGNAFLGLEKSTEAKEAFSAALKSNASEPAALVGLARLSLLDRDTEGGLRLSQQAVDANRNNAEVWLFHAEMLRSLRRLDEALSAYNEALKIRSSFLSAHIGRAMLHIEAKRYAEARADISAARKVKPGALQIHYAQALVDFNEGKHQAALDSLQQVLRAMPNHAPSILLAGAVEYALGSTQQAELHLKTYLDRYPGNTYARKLLALALIKNGHPDQAINALKPELKNARKADDTQLLAIAGEAYMKTKEYDKASEYLEKAAGLAPEAAMIRTALGRSKLAEGESDAAVKELEAAIQLEPKSKEPGILLVLTHIARKEFDKAFTAIEAMEKSSSGDPMVHNLKGTIYVGKSDLESARRSFEKALSLQPNFFPAVQNLAQLDLRQNKPAVAKKRLEDLLKIDPNNVLAMHALASLAASQGKQDESIALMERAYNVKPEAVKPALLLGAQYLRAGLVNKALVHAKNMQVQHANNVDALDLLAQAHIANKDYASAIDAYTRILALDPKLAPAYFRMANVHFKANNIDASVGALKKALSIQPDYLDAQLVLATLEARRGKHSEAHGIAKKLQDNSATSASGFALEGDLLAAQKKPEQAHRAYEKAFKIKPTGPTMIKIHQVLVQLGKEGEADANLMQWLSKQPADVRTRSYFAQRKLEKKQFKSAIEQLEIIVKSEPSNPIVLNNIAHAYHQEKDPRALDFAERAYARAPNSADVMDTLAWILLDRGDTKRSVSLLQNAATISPQSLDIRYHLAVAMLKAGNRNGARDELNAVVSSGKPFASITEAKALLSKL